MGMISWTNSSLSSLGTPGKQKRVFPLWLMENDGALPQGLVIAFDIEGRFPIFITAAEHDLFFFLYQACISLMERACGSSVHEKAFTQA